MCSTSVVDKLVAMETIDGSDVYALAGRDEPAVGVGVTVAPDLANAAAGEHGRASSVASGDVRPPDDSSAA